VKKFLLISFIFFLATNVVKSEISKAYFAGGCFWCMEEVFEKTEGVIEVVSGYSGGTSKNPTYKEVTYGDTGHFEVVEVVYNKSKINFENLANIFWKNIDPFDKVGQFCDKGYSYRSVAFYTNNDEKKLIEDDIQEIEKKFNQKVVTYVRKFEIFYKAEEHHQDYYKEKFLNYLLYKEGCGRQRKLDNIWQ
jgi:peptide-methionine (S)-S-oxide reductase